jgi:hypothetical protein
MALIEQFEAQVPGESGSVDLAALTTPAHRDVFLKSLVLVAYADGHVTDRERDVIRKYADALGFDAAAHTRAWTDVASSLLSVFSGVQKFRAQVVKLGEDMGLDHGTVDRVLS